MKARVVLSIGTLPGFTLFCLLTVSALGAQEAVETAKPDFQRNALRREQSELVLEGSFNYWAVQTGEDALHYMKFQADVEYSFKRNHTLTLFFPYTLSAYDNPEARQTLFYSPGDLVFGYEYLYQKGTINMFFGPRVTVPLGVNNEYAIREGLLPVSGGRFYLGAAFSVTGIRDPVVWNVAAQFQVGLPKEERFCIPLIGPSCWA